MYNVQLRLENLLAAAAMKRRSMMTGIVICVGGNLNHGWSVLYLLRLDLRPGGGREEIYKVVLVLLLLVFGVGIL